VQASGWMLKRVQHDEEGEGEWPGRQSKPARKRKWGRHCCRPHSHRRVGPEGRFTPGVSLQPPGGRRLYRPALAPVPVLSGAGYDPKIFPLPPGGSATDLLARFSSFGDAEHRRSIETGRQVRPADRAPLRLQRSVSCSIRRCPGSHSSTARHFAIASKEVPKSLLLSGCYPVHPKSQSPLSMYGACACAPSRARANRPTYPLLPGRPVDKAG
jgi:hypothetical protein